MKRIFSLFITVFFSSVLCLSACGGGGSSNSSQDAQVPGTQVKEWTFMYYGAADNDAEQYILGDIREMKAGMNDDSGINLIVLADTAEGSKDSVTFGEAFSDSRMYLIQNSSAVRLTDDALSGELDTGDPYVLKNFIQFCKTEYPAEKYCLIVPNHGGTAEACSFREICTDASSGHSIYLGNMSQVLSADESVDLLVFDGSYMSSIETAFQFCRVSSAWENEQNSFHADYLAACPGKMRDSGLDYQSFFSELADAGSGASAAAAGTILVNCQKTSASGEAGQSFVLSDLSKIQTVKDKVDALAPYIKQYPEVKKFIKDIVTDYISVSLHYFDSTVSDEWVNFPFFDFYNISMGLYHNFESTQPWISMLVKGAAKDAADSIDEAVVASFGNSAFVLDSGKENEYPNFTSDKSGLFVFLPYASFKHTNDTADYIYQWWYSPDFWIINGSSERVCVNTGDTLSGFTGGNLRWCRNAAEPAAGEISNWFLFLQFSYDVPDGVWGITHY